MAPHWGFHIPILPETTGTVAGAKSVRTTLKPCETMVYCWYLQGNRIILEFPGWREMDFATIHRYQSRTESFCALVVPPRACVQLLKLPEWIGQKHLQLSNYPQNGLPNSGSEKPSNFPEISTMGCKMGVSPLLTSCWQGGRSLAQWMGFDERKPHFNQREPLLGCEICSPARSD